jgi:hypothetical protein
VEKHAMAEGRKAARRGRRKFILISGRLLCVRTGADASPDDFHYIDATDLDVEAAEAIAAAEAKRGCYVLRQAERRGAKRNADYDGLAERYHRWKARRKRQSGKNEYREFARYMGATTEAQINKYVEALCRRLNKRPTRNSG